MLAAADQPLSAPVAPDAGAGSSKAAIASMQPVPRPSGALVHSVQASTALAAPNIPGLGTPLPRSLQPVPGTQSVGAGSATPPPGAPVSNGMPPRVMGGTVAGAQRVAQGGAPGSRPTAGAQPPQRSPSTSGVRPAAPSPPPLSPLVAEFEAILERTPVDVLRQHGDRLDKMRSALADDQIPTEGVRCW